MRHFPFGPDIATPYANPAGECARADPSRIDARRPRGLAREATVKNNQRKSSGNVGGARPGAGRPKGSLNKATADIKAAAQAYTEDALATLAQIMKAGESEAARVAAANSILDRGFGKPRQSMDLDATTDMTVEIVTGVPRAD